MQDLLNKRIKKEEQEPKPIFFNLADTADQEELSHQLEQNPQLEVIDTYESQLLDFFVINDNPSLHLNHALRDEKFEEYKKEHYAGKEPWQAGKWVLLPWRNTVLHVLDDEAYQVVRTGRNRNLIRPDEQKKFYNSVIGIAGQSVGNSCTLAIVQTGGGKHMRLADMDTLELTNLNRIRGSIAEITNKKVNMAAHQVYELDPYANLELFDDGLTEENIARFFDGPPKLDLVIDEIDNLGMKIRIRQEAKKRGIPVLMAADNGESGLLDIERHDLDNSIPLFHGRAGEDIADLVLNQKLPLPMIGRLIGEKLIGFDIHEERMLESLLEIGNTVPTWPQLGTAAALNGVLVAVAARKILTGQPIVDDRANASIQHMLVPNYDSEESVAKRKQAVADFVKKDDEKLKMLLSRKPE